MKTLIKPITIVLLIMFSVSPATVVLAGNTLNQQVAKLAKDTRELKIELARIKKELEKGVKTTTTGPLSVEERLLNLDSLKQKGLLSNKEYEAKRKEIMADL